MEWLGGKQDWVHDVKFPKDQQRIIFKNLKSLKKMVRLEKINILKLQCISQSNADILNE